MGEILGINFLKPNWILVSILSSYMQLRMTTCRPWYIKCKVIVTHPENAITSLVIKSAHACAHYNTLTIIALSPECGIKSRVSQSCYRHKNCLV